MAWALTWSMSPGVRPASWIARVIACPARSPLGSGATMWKPSEVTLAPIIRARMLAPRALACSSVSMTISAPPSPNTNPFAVLVERAAGTGRVVVVRRHHDAHLRERGDGHRLDLGLDATADRDVGLTEHDLLPGAGDALRTGRARRHRGHHPGFGVPLQPDRRGRAVGHVHLHGQRGDRPHAAVRACRRSRRSAPRSSPGRCRWTPSTGWCRPRANRRSPTPAGPERWPSSAGSPSGEFSMRVSWLSNSSSRCPPMRTGRSNSSTNGSSRVRIPLWPSSSNFHVFSASVARAVVMAMPVTTMLGKPFPVANFDDVSWALRTFLPSLGLVLSTARKPTRRCGRRNRTSC